MRTALLLVAFLFATAIPTGVPQIATAQSGPTTRLCESTRPTNGRCPPGCEFAFTRQTGGAQQIGEFCRLPIVMVREGERFTCDARTRADCIPLGLNGELDDDSCKAAQCGVNSEIDWTTRPDILQALSLSTRATVAAPNASQR